MTMTYKNSNQQAPLDAQCAPSHRLLLQKADAGIRQAQPAVADTHRLHYHLMPQANWMNDPNGLVYYRGYYHVFYQHHPYSPNWGPMHWGHARTKDFLTWEHLPIALAPSENYDLDGCFSGSAVVEGDLLHLFYTGHRVIDGQLIQVQCRATSSDGIHFIKDRRNPLITSFPSDGSPDFRDPKVWQHQESWFMVLGSGKNGRGNVLLYKSKDLIQWDYVGVLAQSDGTQGTIWECPDLFPLSDRHVLLVSPMGVENRRVMYFVGDMDYEAGKFSPQHVGTLDYGPDFYAAQTFSGTKRRLMLAWMDAWECHIPSKKDNWAGALTLPRELLLDESGKLKTQPLPELKGLRRRGVPAPTSVLGEKDQSLPLTDPQAACLEMNLVVSLTSTTASHFSLCFSYAESSEQIVVGYNKVTGELYLDTSEVHAGQPGLYNAPIYPQGQSLDLRIFLDRSSIEVFAHEGAATITARIYPRSHTTVPILSALDGQIEVTSLACWNLAK